MKKWIAENVWLVVWIITVLLDWVLIGRIMGAFKDVLQQWRGTIIALGKYELIIEQQRVELARLRGQPDPPQPSVN